ncbi:MAG: succinylglutamate desuccinylase/aspartoacylase family protein [Nanoarchaeota archaeon]|nr:succinylglutamate desuccinylase/aspartoacylase family protein [Nanoarchaeota archaeon]
MEKIAIVVCLHGDEKYGLEVVRNLPTSLPLFSFIANKKALKENKRFVDADMNRCFPGSPNGNYEERQAYPLLNNLKDFELVIDLHSSSNQCPMFGIITKPNKEKVEFARRLGLSRLVIMPEFFASGKALIDFVKCGISIEIGPHEREENVRDASELINNLNKNIQNESFEVFEVFEIIKKEQPNIIINNFQEVKVGQIIARGMENQTAKFNFVAVLVGEKAYPNTLCLACRRIK